MHSTLNQIDEEKENLPPPLQPARGSADEGPGHWDPDRDHVVGRDSGMVVETFYKGSTLYLGLSVGRAFQAGACASQLNEGNWIKFTADEHPEQGPDSSTPVIVRCQVTGWVLGDPLPN